jgi:hypothetical protein
LLGEISRHRPLSLATKLDVAVCWLKRGLNARLPGFSPVKVVLQMKFLVFCAVLLSSAAWAQSNYTDIDDSTLQDNGTVGWGSCVTCAGGGSNATIATSPFQSRPSRDGASRDFYINGAGYTDGLWWYKLGANDAVSNFKFDFWLNVNNGTQYAQAMEFDVFQFVSNTEFMFGTQCDYASGTWDVWNAANKAWVHSAIACKPFAYNNWYHFTMNFHRTADNVEHYDSLTIVQYNRSGKLMSQQTYSFNQAFAAGTLPIGWGENLGVQFQMDIGPTGAAMQEWVDQVSLTAW